MSTATRSSLIQRSSDSIVSPLKEGNMTSVIRPGTRPVPQSGAAAERLMTVQDLSEMLGVPVATLYGWRYRGEGPPGYRIGRYVRYRRTAVEAWLEGQTDQARLFR